MLLLSSVASITAIVSILGLDFITGHLRAMSYSNDSSCEYNEKEPSVYSFFDYYSYNPLRDISRSLLFRVISDSADFSGVSSCAYYLGGLLTPGARIFAFNESLRMMSFFPGQVKGPFQLNHTILKTLYPFEKDTKTNLFSRAMRSLAKSESYYFNGNPYLNIYEKTLKTELVNLKLQVHSNVDDDIKPEFRNSVVVNLSFQKPHVDLFNTTEKLETTALTKSLLQSLTELKKNNPQTNIVLNLSSAAEMVDYSRCFLNECSKSQEFVEAIDHVRVQEFNPAKRFSVDFLASPTQSISPLCKKLDVLTIGYQNIHFDAQDRFDYRLDSRNLNVQSVETPYECRHINVKRRSLTAWDYIASIASFVANQLLSLFSVYVIASKLDLATNNFLIITGLHTVKFFLKLLLLPVNLLFVTVCCLYFYATKNESFFLATKLTYSPFCDYEMKTSIPFVDDEQEQFSPPANDRIVTHDQLAQEKALKELYKNQSSMIFNKIDVDTKLVKQRLVAGA